MRALLFGLGFAALLSTPALAGVKTTVNIDNYAVSGATGEAVVSDMDKRGPRQGWLARAIAQTKYSVAWEMSWKPEGGNCRLASAQATLAINFRYPELSTATPRLGKKWAEFMRGVRAHEETHARVAREMVAEAYKGVMAVRTSKDPSCSTAQRKVSDLVKATYARYEARQVRFDATEHRAGGNVEHLVARLTAD